MLDQDYIHKVPVILHENLQRQSHKPNAPPPPTVTYLQLLIYAHTTSRTHQTRNVSLGSLTLPATEAEVFMKLVLLYK
jgi:hypothetical protein